MIKKNFKKLLSISLATGILIGGITASAEVIGYVTESDGVRYEYSQEDLIESIVNKTALYERYTTERLIALADDKNGYIDAEDVIRAIVQASMNQERFSVNDYTESKVAKIVELDGVKRLNSSGQVLPGDQVDDSEDNEPEDERLEYTDAKYFEFDRSSGTITGYKSNGPKDVVIPKEIDGITVTSIGDGAFYDNNLTSIEIPNSVTSIEDWAFRENNLERVEIPSSVTSIGEYTFAYNNLEHVEIPNSVTSIGISAFSRNNLESVEIPSSVTIVEGWVFYDNNLEHVEIPSSVTSIGDGAFNYNNLTSIEIPNSVTSIGISAFASNSLESIDIPNSVTSIGIRAFASNSLAEKDVKLGSGHPSFWLYDKDDSTKLLGHILGGDNGVLVIPKEATSIEDWAFYDSNLTSVVIPDSITNIGWRAFSYNNLESVEIPRSVTSIGDWAFHDNSLTRVRVPSHTKLNNWAFNDNVEVIRY